MYCISLFFCHPVIVSWPSHGVTRARPGAGPLAPAPPRCHLVRAGFVPCALDRHVAGLPHRAQSGDDQAVSLRTRTFRTPIHLARIRHGSYVIFNMLEIFDKLCGAAPQTRSTTESPTQCHCAHGPHLLARPRPLTPLCSSRPRPLRAARQPPSGRTSLKRYTRARCTTGT